MEDVRGKMGTTITIHDRQFRKYISSARIQKAIAGIAKEINKDYNGKRPLFISILNGSFLFTADLMKKVNIE
jgi:hypoxanthine-guanine phosphoribosyltransferase